MIHIKYDEFFKALSIKETANYILEIENKLFSEETTVELLSAEIERTYGKNEDIVYAEQKGINVKELEDLLIKHSVKYVLN